MLLKIAPLLLLTLMLSDAALAGTKIYTFLDEQGVRHFTDAPDDNRYRLLLIAPSERTVSGDRYDQRLLARATQYDALIEHAAAAAGVDANLVRAVIVVESGFNPAAVSRKGALGLMQLMPATAARFGATNALDPHQNVAAGARYLRFLKDRFAGDVRLVVAAYNAGEQAVDRNGGQIPPYTETMAYVPRVLKFYRMLDQPRPTLARQG